MVRSLIVGTFLLGLAPVASAQEEAPVFTFDTLLVAPVQPLDPSLAPAADRLTAELQERLSKTVLTVDISEVPIFETQQYDGRTYVLSCPTAEYTGCAMIVGQRVEADWVVGGTLAPIGDELMGGEGQLLLQVHFVDVRATREVLSFGVVLGTDGSEALVLDQLVAAFDRIIDGAFEELDIRGKIEDPVVREQLERHREQIIASSLDELEQTLGVLERSEPIRYVQPPKVNRSELQQEYADRDDTAPWERLGMTDAQYVRFRNSGETLEDWRYRLRGRFGQVLLRGGLLTGGGPWGVHHEGQYLQAFDPASASFSTVEVAQYQEVRQSPSTGFEGELAFGVAPFAEIGFALAVRTSQVTFRFDQETEGEPPFLGGESGTTVSTLVMGPRLTLIPLPSLPVRPTATVGIAWWQGRGVPPQAPFERLEPPDLTVLQLAPGVEVSAGRHLNIWARGMVDQPIGGSTVDERAVGGGLLPTPPVAQQDFGTGFGVQAGIQVRLTLLKDRRPVEAVEQFDEEPDDL